MAAKLVRRLVLFTSVGMALASCGVSYERSSEGGGSISDLQKREVRRAVGAVRRMLDNMQDVGYVSYTPTQAVELLVRYLNTSSARPEGEPEVPSLVPEIAYVECEPTGPWQVVLIPLEVEREILVQGYAEDTTEPVCATRLEVPLYW